MAFGLGNGIGLCGRIVDQDDSWVWKLSKDGGYSVKCACQIIDNSLLATAIEDVQHVIFKCDVAVEVWKKVATWLDLQILAIDDISMMLDWVEASISDAKKRKVVGVIIYTTIWMLWRFKNNIVFQDPKMKKSHIYENIIIHSFDCSMKRCGKCNIAWTLWLQNPIFHHSL
ncbi:hypothetical protein CTI12_AA610320 [Artemisia annua]|uniref:RNA-directed DNA polymerase, eukaryota, Reverse transcriptase zinc-binding domain protein n=1 Tax=Artemisia annua TaxID=35608 RepID=A0A2U1KF06_ARTAN|nr:hypothetical protein CTI12_AA610320 [Artemisia annua]